jgi:hypothetical protein
MKYRLHWTPTGWSTPDPFRGVPHSVEFESLEKLIDVMSKCIYSGEWVTDENNNKIELDWNTICQ